MSGGNISVFKSPGVEPVLGVVGPGDHLLFGEPNLDFPLSILGRVGAVADVAFGTHTEVATDGAGLGVDGVGLSKEIATCGNDPIALPYHGDHGGSHEVFNQCREKWHPTQSVVVGRNLLFLDRDDLEGPQIEALLLKSADDSPHQPALHTIRFNHNICPLSHLNK